MIEACYDSSVFFSRAFRRCFLSCVCNSGSSRVETRPASPISIGALVAFTRKVAGLATVVTFIVLVAFVFFFFGEPLWLECLNVSIGSVDARVICVVALYAQALGSSGGARSLNRAAPHLPLLVKLASMVYKGIKCIGCGETPTSLLFNPWGKACRKANIFVVSFAPHRAA
jgi:hypothetical protein